MKIYLETERLILRQFTEDDGKIELGYRLKKSEWSKGYVTEGELLAGLELAQSAASIVLC